MANNEPYRKRIAIEDKKTKIMTEVQVFIVTRGHRKEAETLTRNIRGRITLSIDT